MHLETISDRTFTKRKQAKLLTPSVIYVLNEIWFYLQTAGTLKLRIARAMSAYT